MVISVSCEVKEIPKIYLSSCLHRINEVFYFFDGGQVFLDGGD